MESLSKGSQITLSVLGVVIPVICVLLTLFISGLVRNDDKAAATHTTLHQRITKLDDTIDVEAKMNVAQDVKIETIQKTQDRTLEVLGGVGEKIDDVQNTVNEVDELGKKIDEIQDEVQQVQREQQRIFPRILATPTPGPTP